MGILREGGNVWSSILAEIAGGVKEKRSHAETRRHGENFDCALSVSLRLCVRRNPYRSANSPVIGSTGSSRAMRP
jgi:hypothetical protein